MRVFKWAGGMLSSGLFHPGPGDCEGSVIIGSLATYRRLLLTLVVVYGAMAGLSAVDLRSIEKAPGRPGDWRLDVPRFVVDDTRGTWSFNWFNQRKILEQAAINLTLGVGMTFVILTGGIDLSVGALLALCNVIFVRTVRAWGVEGAPDASALLCGGLACLTAGALCGAINGSLSVALRIPSFIVTLGTLLVFRGMAYWTSGAQTHVLACPAPLVVGIPIGISLLAVVAAQAFLGTTAIGRQIYAVGGNFTASRYAGVRTNRVRILCFALSGLCAGLAGVIYWSRVSSGSYIAGDGAELHAIAAVVLGGTRLAGGEGSIIGTVIGALIMAVLANGLNTAGIDDLTQKVIVGCVLIAAAYIDSRRTRDSVVIM